MQLAILLLLAGIVLAVFEMVAPGFGIFGISALVSIIISFVIIIATVPFGVFIVAGIAIVLAIFVKLALDYIKKRQLYGKLILDETLQMDKKEVGDLEFFIGREGVTATPLKPFGTVDFNNATLEACSEGQYIKENIRVKVVNISGNKLIVRKLSQY